MALNKWNQEINTWRRSGLRFVEKEKGDSKIIGRTISKNYKGSQWTTMGRFRIEYSNYFDSIESEDTLFKL